MPLLALVSYGIWFYVIKLRRVALLVARVPRHFEIQLRNDLSAHSLEANIASYSSAPDALSQAVSHVLLAAKGARPVDEAFDRFQQNHLAHIGRDILLLSALTAAAPLLGLLGTVMGMVATFEAVSAQFGNTSMQVAEGISQALITTQCGLVIAIPGLIGKARVRRLMDHARVRMGECRIHLVFGLNGESHGNVHT